MRTIGLKEDFLDLPKTTIEKNEPEQGVLKAIIRSSSSEFGNSLIIVLIH